MAFIVAAASLKSYAFDGDWFDIRSLCDPTSPD